MQYKINCCFRCELFIHVACLRICALFYFYLVCLHVCAYAFKFKVHCRSALGSGAAGLPYYYTPPVCVPAVLGGLAVWRHTNKKTNVKKSENFLGGLAVW